MDFKTRSYEKELLDRDNVPFTDIIGTLEELNTINSFLGGHNITRKGMAFLMGNNSQKQPITIAEIGCGGGDNLKAVGNYLAKRGQLYSLTGIDIKAECIRFGQQNAAANINWICSDYREVSWPSNKPDIIFSSLFCHHFTDEELIVQLKWLYENSRLGFFINDLHRHRVAYYSISLLTRFFSMSRMVKNDGPLSVKRAFKKNEWIKLLDAAGINNYTIKWHWAFRYLVCVRK